MKRSDYIQNRDPYQLPNMTDEQALHILSQSYDAYPFQVRSQAVARLTSLQQYLQDQIDKSKQKTLQQASQTGEGRYEKY